MDLSNYDEELAELIKTVPQEVVALSDAFQSNLDTLAHLKQKVSNPARELAAKAVEYTKDSVYILQEMEKYIPAEHRLYVICSGALSNIIGNMRAKWWFGDKDNMNGNELTQQALLFEMAITEIGKLHLCEELRKEHEDTVATFLGHKPSYASHASAPSRNSSSGCLGLFLALLTVSVSLFGLGIYGLAQLF